MSLKKESEDYFHISISNPAGSFCSEKVTTGENYLKTHTHKVKVSKNCAKNIQRMNTQLFNKTY